MDYFKADLQLLPQSIIPSISSLAIGSNKLGSVWGSAVGGLITWELFELGLSAVTAAGTIAFPEILSAGTAYARGTGAELTGGMLSGTNGLAPSV